MNELELIGVANKWTFAIYRLASTSSFISCLLCMLVIHVYSCTSSRHSLLPKIHQEFQT